MSGLASYGAACTEMLLLDGYSLNYIYILFGPSPRGALYLELLLKFTIESCQHCVGLLVSPDGCLDRLLVFPY